MDNANLNLNEDMESFKPKSSKSPGISKDDTVSALRDLTTAVSEMKDKLQEFVLKFDKYTKAGRF